MLVVLAVAVFAATVKPSCMQAHKWNSPGAERKASYSARCQNPEEVKCLLFYKKTQLECFQALIPFSTNRERVPSLFGCNQLAERIEIEPLKCPLSMVAKFTCKMAKKGFAR